MRKGSPPTPAKRVGNVVPAGPAKRAFRPERRSDLARIQRARVLGAMVEVCGERGVGNVTVAHVVARAGVSRRTFYELFEDREDCFLAAFDHALERAAATVVPAYEDGNIWRARLRAGLTALLGFLEDEPGLGRLLVVDALGAGPRALVRRTSVLGVLIETVDRGRRMVGGEPSGGKEPPPLAAEGVVGAVFSVIHARLLEQDVVLSGLLNPLMSMIVMPYLGQSTARRELNRPIPKARQTQSPRTDPLRDLDLRLTYRTILVLMAIAEHPGASNRQIGEQAGVHDQGQISKLLGRLHNLGLVQNTGAGHNRGAPNEWALTTKGQNIQHAISAQTGR
jgi:AcrR family transcriptional regulator/DNA-binding MarR family transcriptional regulator